MQTFKLDQQQIISQSIFKILKKAFMEVHYAQSKHVLG